MLALVALLSFAVWFSAAQAPRIASKNSKKRRVVGWAEMGKASQIGTSFLAVAPTVVKGRLEARIGQLPARGIEAGRDDWL